ncbi:MAG: hypothetical protein LBQ94_06420 [Treponema sp.]|nr:hypothetical protein [Treponema sp.]
MKIGDICVKCLNEGGKGSRSECNYVGVKMQALKTHSWMDREEFIDDLRAKLPPFIRDRVAEWRKKSANNLSLFTARMETYEKRLKELQAAHDRYLKEGLPRDVEKKKQQLISEAESYEKEHARVFENEKQRAVRPFLINVIGSAIGLFIGFKWIIPLFNLGIPDLFMNLGMIVLAVFILGKSTVKFLKARRETENALTALRSERDEKIMKATRYAESQEFADKLSDEWYTNNGFDKLESTIKEEQHKWDRINSDLERHISAAERALSGSDEDLLYFYRIDNKTKRHYIEDGPYAGEW